MNIYELRVLNKSSAHLNLIGYWILNNRYMAYRVYLNIDIFMVSILCAKVSVFERCL